MIRVATTAVVALLAAVAAVVSYRHILEVVREHGETGWVAYLVPLTVDGLLVAASLTLLEAARRRHTRHWLSWVAVAVGISLTLGANVLHGWKHGVIGAIIAALPAVTLTISFELLMGLIRRGAVPAAAPVEAVAVPVQVTDSTVTPDRESPEEDASADSADPGTADPDSAPVEQADVPALPAPSPARTPVLAPVADELFPVAATRYADNLAAGQVPAISRIKKELKVGQPRAARIRAYLGQLAEA
ncbi:hypothetical protein GCM10017673_34030 [Streptosporangium violaceochromogenes]|nr:hypothetical protein GCM10017673_34030 [Streptosporangium violaceochromogenes]